MKILAVFIGICFTGFGAYCLSLGIWFFYNLLNLNNMKVENVSMFIAYVMGTILGMVMVASVYRSLDLFDVFMSIISVISLIILLKSK